MFPTYQSYNASAWVDGGVSQNCVVTKPSGLAVGDLMILHFSQESVSGWGTTPSGWTQVETYSQGDAGAVMQNFVMYKMATASDVAATDFTFVAHATSAAHRAAIYRVTGAKGSTIVKSSGVTKNSTSVSISGVTPIQHDTLLMALICEADASTSFSGYAIATSNPSWTEVDDAGTTLGVDHAMSMAYANRPETTATGNFTLTAGDATADTWVCLLSITNLVRYEAKTSVSASGGSSHKNITLPSGTTVGDLLILFYSWAANASAPAPTIHYNGTGASLVEHQSFENNGADYHSGVHYIYPNATDISNGYIQYSGSDSYSYTGTIEVYRISGATARGAMAYGDDTQVGNTPSYNNTVTPVSPVGIMLFLISSGIYNFVGTAAGYAITTDNPSWTEISDLQVNDGAHEAGLHTAWAIRDDVDATGNSSVTFTTSGAAESRGIVLYINDPTSIIAYPTVQELTLSIPAPAITGDANVDGSLNEGTFTVNNPTISTPAPSVRNRNKNPLATVTNRNKS